MTYLKLKNNQLRISLTKNETDKIFGNSETLDKDDPKTSLALKMLLKKALIDNNLAADYSNVLIEVARNLSGGYDIYFSKGKHCAVLPKTALAVIEFANLKQAIAFAENIATSNCQIDDSRLYKFENKYRIIFLTKCGVYRIPALLEFADRLYPSRIETAKTVEHGKLLIKENAIDILSKL